MEKIALILDLDNTLYSWMDAYAPALIATIDYLAEETKLTKKEIRESFKRVFQEHKSVEVIDSVKELDIWDAFQLHNGETANIQDSAQSLFTNKFKRGLRLYPNVRDVLKWAKSKGYFLFAYSDARAYWINFRLRELDIDCYFDKIFTMQDESLDGFVNTYSTTFFQYIPEQCKPSTVILNKIIQDYGLCVKNVYVIGDSKKKDILPAVKMGLNNIWARYGKSNVSAYKRLLGSITPWSSSQRSNGGSIKPQHIIDNFYDVISIIQQE